MLQRTRGRRKKKNHGKADPLDVQISVELHLPDGIEPTRQHVDEAIRYRQEHGEDHPLAKTHINRWRNPNRTGEGANWRKGNQEDAWRTLGPALPHANISIGTIRRRKGNR